MIKQGSANKNKSYLTYSTIDRLIISFDKLLNQNTLNETPASPAQDIVDLPTKSQEDYKLSAKLMRINHSGEVCAQALYHGQSLFTENKEQYEELMHSAQEELVHLTWCKERLSQLNSRPSLLTPLWFIGSYIMGVVASLYGDRYSNGFIYETEHQVSRHLESHLTKLPNFDLKSRAILTQMLTDELQHAENAQTRGINELPPIIKTTMHYTANIFKYITAIV